ncbi:hypothetical protein K450DRAFT_237103 [Umbelopsis ramanniana AG]|uniref:ribonuclease T2 n=1 Tax=Umbelopsis ramanniana AG TaxID=1314678 RepID=A0AAD5EAL6_UMBRA|nr:uncharacterized protein K450DRAFT_237103 [Umbelopsis ramanniana AG]KAI8580453.1 hypothetical protein K450DRAFT_237103 [Umbelopsis ramanniana AG]
MLFSTLAATVFGSIVASAVPASVPTGTGHTCPAKELWSCSTAALSNSADGCCVENKSGLVMLAAFWDIHAGSLYDFTIHGTWSDHCSGGTWDQFCDSAREYQNVTAILQDLGEYQLLQEMNNVWTNSEGSTDSFWAHEWGKHGTCFSTFNPSCYSNYKTGQEMADFFRMTVNFYHKFNVYKALERHNIVPGHKYKTEQFTKALVKEFGTVPNLQCDYTTGELNAVWLYFHAKGPVRNLELRPTVPNAANGCNDTIPYPTKYPGEINGHYPELTTKFNF